MGKIIGIIKQAFILTIKAYQWILSPFFGQCCRFYPSCSFYAIEALKTHGIFYALYLIIYRILRCHPGCQGGTDLVPERKIKC